MEGCVEREMSRGLLMRYDIEGARARGRQGGWAHLQAEQAKPVYKQASGWALAESVHLPPFWEMAPVCGKGKGIILSIQRSGSHCHTGDPAGIFTS